MPKANRFVQKRRLIGVLDLILRLDPTLCVPDRKTDRLVLTETTILAEYTLRLENGVMSTSLLDVHSVGKVTEPDLRGSTVHGCTQSNTFV
jgi:hypothetical protein